MLSVPAVYLLYLSWQDIVLKTIQAVLEFGEYGEAHPQPFQPWLNSALCVCDLCLQRAGKAKNENKQNKANKKKRKKRGGKACSFTKQIATARYYPSSGGCCMSSFSLSRSCFFSVVSAPPYDLFSLSQGCVFVSGACVSA